MSIFNKGKEDELKRALYNSLRKLDSLLRDFSKEISMEDSHSLRKRVVELRLMVRNARPLIIGKKTPLSAIANTIPSFILEIDKLTHQYPTVTSVKIQEMINEINPLLARFIGERGKAKQFPDFENFLGEANDNLKKSGLDLRFRNVTNRDLESIYQLTQKYPESLDYFRIEIEGTLKVSAVGGRPIGIVLEDSEGVLKGFSIGYDAKYYLPKHTYQPPKKLLSRSVIREASAISPDLRGNKKVNFLGYIFTAFEKAAKSAGYKRILTFPSNFKLVEVYKGYGYKVHEEIKGNFGEYYDVVALMYKNL